MSLSSPEACKLFVAVEDPAKIARRLRQDQQLCRDRKLPTVLAYFVPDTGSAQADEIAAHLLPQTEVPIPSPVKRMQYAGVIDGIKAYLAQMKHLDDSDRDPINPIINGLIKSPNTLTATDEGDRKGILSEIFDTSELDRTIKTLVDLRTNGVLRESDVFSNILDILKSLAAPGNHIPRKQYSDLYTYFKNTENHVKCTFAQTSIMIFNYVSRASAAILAVI